MSLVCGSCRKRGKARHDIVRRNVVPPKSWRLSYAASGLVLDSLIS